jgi:hypothetical protein
MQHFPKQSVHHYASLSCPPAGIRRNLRIVAHSFLSYPLADICRNLHIVAHSFLSCPPAGIRRNLRIVTHSFLSYSLADICRNLHIVAHSFLSCPLAGIRRTLLLRLSHSSDIRSIRFKHTRIICFFGFFKKYLKILDTKANFQTFVSL